MLAEIALGAGEERRQRLRIGGSAAARNCAVSAKVSRSAARSRGPPRPSPRRAMARAMSAVRRRCCAQVLAQALVGAKNATRVEPLGDARGSVKRRGELLGQKPRAGAGHGAVDAASRLPLRSPESVSVSSRLRRVAASISMAAPAARRRGGTQQRQACPAASGRRSRRARPPPRARRARTRRSRRARARRKAPRGACAPPSLSKRGIGQRRQSAAFQSSSSSKRSGRARSRSGTSSLARREPRQRRGERRLRHLLRREIAGREIEPGEAEARRRPRRAPRDNCAGARRADCPR